MGIKTLIGLVGVLLIAFTLLQTYTPFTYGKTVIGYYIAIPIGWDKGYLLQIFIPNMKGLKSVMASHYRIDLRILIPGNYTDIAMKGGYKDGVYTYVKEPPQYIINSFITGSKEIYKYYPHSTYPFKDLLDFLKIDDTKLIELLQNYKSGVYGVYILSKYTQEGCKYIKAPVVWVTPITSNDVYYVVMLYGVPTHPKRYIHVDSRLFSLGMLLVLVYFLI